VWITGHTREKSRSDAGNYALKRSIGGETGPFDNPEGSRVAGGG